MKQNINEIKRIQQLAGIINEGHYWDTEINKDLKTGQKIQFGDGEKTAHNILDLNKNPELKQQVQVGDLVYNTLGKRWIVSKIEGDKISLRTLDSLEYGAMDLTMENYEQDNTPIKEAIDLSVLDDVESLIDPGMVDNAMDAIGAIWNSLEKEGFNSQDIKTYIDMQINKAFAHQIGGVSRG